MEQKAKINIVTEKIMMPEADFETVKSLLEGAILNEMKNANTSVEDEMEKIFSELDADGDVSELITEGCVTCKSNGAVILQYTESEISGMDGCITKIMFSEKKPSFVVVVRDGIVNTSLSFETGKRHVSTYNTPYMPFRLCVNTIRVENTFFENGEIAIEYLLEIRGLSTERNLLKIKVDILD